MDNLSKLGITATEVLMKESFKKDNYLPEEVGLVLTNQNGSLDSDLNYEKTISEVPSPSLFVYTLPNIVIGEICIKNNFRGENAFFIFKDFNAAFLEFYVNDLFENTALKACFCGWIDAVKEKYKAVLYLVEKQADDEYKDFNQENLNKIYAS